LLDIWELSGLKERERQNQVGDWPAERWMNQFILTALDLNVLCIQLFVCVCKTTGECLCCLKGPEGCLGACLQCLFLHSSQHQEGEQT